MVTITSKETSKLLKEFATPSDFRGIRLILNSWGSILGIAVADSVMPNDLGLFGGVLHLVSILAVATRFGALESCTHEASHFTLFRRRALNEALDFLFALPIWESVQSYRAHHRIHHERRGQPEDPAVELYSRTGVNRFPTGFWWVMLIRPLLGYHTLAYLNEKIAIVRTFPRFRWKLAVFLGLLLSVVHCFDLWQQLLCFYVIPVFLVLPVLLFWSEVSDHAGLERWSASPAGRNVLDKLLGFVIYPHGEGYHLVHHLHPGIPTHRLAEAHAKLLSFPIYREQGQTVETLSDLAEKIRCSPRAKISQI